MSPRCLRVPTEAEVKWCDQMRKLMKRKPKTLTLFCNGNMHALCTHQVNNQVEKGGCMPQPLPGIDALGPADGGDF